VKFRTRVSFEAPHRIADTRADFVLEFGGERQAVVAHELTKTHETIYRGSLADDDFGGSAVVTSRCGAIDEGATTEPRRGDRRATHWSDAK
jgi:16S rRNA (cytidine1402-2'-O)-methyltransferase